MAATAGPEIERLIALLGKLPGLGPRSARRAALALLKRREQLLEPLTDAMIDARAKVRTCTTCGSLDTSDPCAICADTARDGGLLCVVEEVGSVWALERASAFRGRYHCLGGKLSPLDRVSPEDLRIPPLVRRIEAAPEEIEVILALGSDVEGEATANYLAELLRGRNCRLTRIAQGLPAGGGLEHADELTLLRAMQGRRSVW